MTIKTNILALFICLSGLASSETLAAVPVARDSTPPANQTWMTQCLPVGNLLVETHQGGAATISWDTVANVPAYNVKVTHSSGYVLMDTSVGAPPVMVHGLKTGERYHVKVCYRCPETNKIICESREFDYIIIDENIVMVDDQGCSCSNPVPQYGKCIPSNSSFYALTQPKIYNIELKDESKMTIVVQDGYANPVGNCPNDYDHMGYSLHGESDTLFPYYVFGANKIYFHGSDFCIQGAPPKGVNYCDIRSKSRNIEPSESPAVVTAIYPNPFDQWIAISLQNSTAKESALRVELTDATGRLVMAQRFPAHSEQVRLETESVPSGFYVVRLIDADGLIAVKPLIKTE